MTTDNVTEMTPEQLRDELAATKRVAQLWLRKATERKKELAQCRTELAAVDAALDVEKSAHRGSVLIADDVVNEMRQEVKQLQTDLKLNARMPADQCDQAREAENKATVLRRQLAGMEAGRDFWRREYGRNVKRLATLDTAEADLRAERQLRRGAESQAIELRLAVHKLELSVDLERQAVRTERRLRQVTEKHVKESDDYLQWLHRILRGGGYILSTNEDGIPVLAHNPLRKLEREKAKAEQRADNAEAQLGNGHGTLTAAGIPLSDASGKLSITGRVVRLRQRAERAEALAQLVTLELVELLVQLASNTRSLIGEADKGEGVKRLWRGDVKSAERLAAQIREVLDDSQA